MAFRKLFYLLLITPFFTIGQDSIQSTLSEPTVIVEDNEQLEIVPVIHKTDTLFYLKSLRGNYPVELRARQMNSKIENASLEYNKLSDSIYLRHTNDFIEIIHNGNMVFVVTQLDADLEKLTLNETAQYRLKQLRNSFDKKVSLTTKEWFKRLGFVLLSIFVLLGILKIINFFFRKINTRLSKIERKFLEQKSNILKYFIPNNTANIFVFISDIIRIAFLGIIIFVCLPFVFSFFPFAENLVEVFYGYIEEPIIYVANGIINFIPSLFFIIIIALTARYVVRVLKAISEDVEIGRFKIKNFHKDWARPTSKLMSLFIYALALVLIFPYLPGSGSSAFQGVSIFIGAIISFGSTSAIANIIAGVVITYMRPFQIGDRVKIDNIIGDIIDKTILVTHIRTPKNEDVTIPNANILTSKIYNYSNTESGSVILYTTVTLGYDLTWQTANELLIEAANRTPLILKDPAPFVLQTSLDDYYVSYQLNAHTIESKKMPFIYSEMHKNILEVFDAAGVEILSPAYMAARDGNVTTVPSAIKPDTKSPISRIVDHLTGRNQQNIYKSSSNDSSDS